VGLDWADLDFPGLDIPGFDFTGFDLSGAVLRGFEFLAVGFFFEAIILGMPRGKMAVYQTDRKCRDYRAPQGDTGLTPITIVTVVSHKGIPKGYRSKRVLLASHGYSIITT
jgi:hypothetical protein